jgi:hypothetical protein
MTDEAVVAGISAINKTASKTRDQVHMVACSIIRNWAESGDVSTAAKRASELTLNVDPSHAQKAVNWFATHCAFQWDTQAKAYTYTATTVTADTFQAAKAASMYALTKDADLKPFDNMAELQKWLDRSTTRAAKAKEGDVINLEAIRKVREILTAA